MGKLVNFGIENLIMASNLPILQTSPLRGTIHHLTRIAVCLAGSLGCVDLSVWLGCLVGWLAGPACLKWLLAGRMAGWVAG
jgi:hypothetical protein